MKHSLAAVPCAAALIATLGACGSANDTSGLPASTGGSTPSTTATSRPATTTPAATDDGPVALTAHSTHTYGGLMVEVNLPADIPGASRPSMLLFSEFLQADGRTTARSRLDPSLARLASPNVVQDTKAAITAQSARGVGSVTYTVDKVHTVAGRSTLVTGCLDQSKIVHLRKDGSRFVDPNAKKYPTLKMSANVSRGVTGLKVTSFTFVPAPC